MNAGLFQQLSDVTALVPIFVLKFFQPIIESNHPRFHLANCRFRDVFELRGFLQLRVLLLAQEFHFFVESLLVSFEIFRPLIDLLVQSFL